MAMSGTGTDVAATDATLMPVETQVEDLQAADDKADKQCRLVLYWVVFVLTIAVIVFLSGAVFSCRAFDNHKEEEDFVYGYRGFINNDTNECTSWDEHPNSYYEPWYTLFYMGIAAVVLSVMALAVWILEEIVCVRTMATDSSSLSRRFVARIPFAVVMVATGILSFLVLIGTCDNIPPLGPGGVDCHLTAWTTLGFVASLSACVTAFVPCLTDCITVREYMRGVPNLRFYDGV